MYDVKPIAAENITALRQAAGMTQLELAQKLNYSDKAVSKWERGESVPDVSVLYEISRLFGVSVDYLITDHKNGSSPEAPAAPTAPRNEARDEKKRKRNRAFITAMSVILVWLVATVVYVVLDIALRDGAVMHVLAFVYAPAASCVVWLVLNTVWFSRRRNFLIISLLMWTLLCAVAVTVYLCGVAIWQIMALGVPGQVMIVLWSKLRFRSAG